MKKKIFFILMLFTMISAMPLMAQSDGFFNYSNSDPETRSGNVHYLGGEAHHNEMISEEIPQTPLGSGLLVLFVGGMAYAALKKKGE